jgi:Cdc6-like AAA superfamily ATPase
MASDRTKVELPAGDAPAKRTSLLQRLSPKTLEDCFLLQDAADFLKRVRKSGSIPDTILHGPTGAGKTTVADFLVEHFHTDNSYKMDAFFHHRRSIDVRGMERFAVVPGLAPGPRVCLIEHADYLARAQQLKIYELITRFRASGSQSCVFLLTAYDLSPFFHPAMGRVPG